MSHTIVICCLSWLAKMFFGMSAWTPRTISTTWVTRKLTAMLHRAYASSLLILAWAARNLIAFLAATVIAALRSLSRPIVILDREIPQSLIAPNTHPHATMLSARVR